VGRKPKPAGVRAMFFTARASGATLRQAVAAARVSKTTGHDWFTQSGDVRPRIRRPRTPLRFSLEEREIISRGLAQKKTLTAIAGELGRSVSTVSREVARNSGPNGYRAARADRLAVLRTARPRPKLAEDPILRRHVEEKLRLRWSPQQISRRSIIEFRTMGRCGCPTETIYTSLFVQTTAVLGTELTSHLRTRRVPRRPQRRALPRSQSRRIPDMVPISQRPDSVWTEPCQAIGNLNDVVKPPACALEDAPNAGCRGAVTRPHRLGGVRG
jgi:transposase, IS30 family